MITRSLARRLGAALSLAVLLGAGVLAATPAQAADTATLTGTVVAPPGVSITRLQACAYPAPTLYESMAGSLRCASVADSGAFTLTSLPASTEVIVGVRRTTSAGPAVGLWFAGDTAIPMRAQRFSTDDGDVGTLTTVLTGALTIRVTDKQPGTMKLLKGNGELIVSQTIPSTGVVTFSGLYPGDYRFEASRAGEYAKTQRGVASVVTSGATTTTTFSRAKGGAITGTVSNGQGGGVGFVPLVLTGDNGTSLRGTTNSRGGFAFRGLNSGTYFLRVNEGADKGVLTLRSNYRTLTVKAGATTSSSMVLGAAGVAVMPTYHSDQTLALVESATGRATTIHQYNRTHYVGHLGPGAWSLIDRTTSGSDVTVGRRWFTVEPYGSTEVAVATARSAGTIVTGQAAADVPTERDSIRVLVSVRDTGFADEAFAAAGEIEPDGTFTTEGPLPDGYYDVSVFDFDFRYSWPVHRMLIKGGTATVDLSADRRIDRDGYASPALSFEGAPVVGRVFPAIPGQLTASTALANRGFTFGLRSGISSAAYYLTSPGLRAQIPAYFTVSPSKLTKGSTVTITGIAGGQ